MISKLDKSLLHKEECVGYYGSKNIREIAKYIERDKEDERFIFRNVLLPMEHSLRRLFGHIELKQRRFKD